MYPSLSFSTLSQQSRRIQQYIERELHKHGMLGVSSSHGDIIYTLYYYGKMTMKELASKIDRDKSTLTALVNKLTQLGYVEKVRCLEDKRVTYISISEKGSKFQGLFESISSKCSNNIYCYLTDIEKQSLTFLLNKINI